MANKRNSVFIRKNQSGRKPRHKFLWREHLREYQSWSAMKARCLDEDHRAFPYYGGKGIKICDRWLNGQDDLTGFDCFVTDMGRRPAGTSLDREDNEKHYCPENCQWSTLDKQGANKGNTVWITVSGETKSLADWGRHTGLGGAAIQARYRRGLRGAELIEPRKKPLKKMVTINGETKSVRQWAEFSGLKERVIHSRLEKGLAGEDLIKAKEAQPLITIKGVTKTILEWAASSGIPDGRIRYRLHKGWPHDDLLLPPDFRPLIKRKS